MTFDEWWGSERIDGHMRPWFEDCWNARQPEIDELVKQRDDLLTVLREAHKEFHFLGPRVMAEKCARALSACEEGK